MDKVSKLKRLGTKYGGWLVPNDISLDSKSIIYSAGAGEDISFDLQIQSLFDCFILLIDPTLRSEIHFNEIKEYYKNKNWIFKFSGNTQKDYKKNIKYLDVDFSKIEYFSKALWDSKDQLKFYKQEKEQNVSQSLINNMFGPKFDFVETLSLKDIMTKNNHKHIDLLKLDIEGSEIRVLNSMLDDQIYPNYLCVEFDLKLKGKDKDNETEKTISRLKNSGYIELINDNLNITFYYEEF